MFAPMLLGYALGAIGVYAALYRLAPLSGARLDRATHPVEDNVVYLFDLPAEDRKAA